MRFWVILAFGGSFAMAAEKCKFENISEFKAKILQGSPVEEELSARQKSVQAMVEKAKQRPNPSVEMEYQRGDQFGLEVNTYRVKALHTIELGNKREKRIQTSLARKALLESKLDLNKAVFYVEALIDYRRAQQLELQVEAVKEAISTYQRIINTLSKRKRLTPEERVSLSTLQLALGDYEGRLHELIHEKETLVVRISYWAGCENPTFKYLVKAYPKLPDYQLNPKKGQAKLVNQSAQLAQSELETQRSLGFSNLAVGPLFAYQQQGEDQFFSAGVGVTFNAPVFHTNTGGKLEAARKLREKEIEAKNHVELLRLKLKKELHVYEHSLKSLKKMPRPRGVSKKHREAQKLFRRGVISIPMVIEAHRQHVEYLRSWFEIENDILKSLKEIYLLTENQDLIQKIFD